MNLTVGTLDRIDNLLGTLIQNRMVVCFHTNSNYFASSGRHRWVTNERVVIQWPLQTGRVPRASLSITIPCCQGARGFSRERSENLGVESKSVNGSWQKEGIILRYFFSFFHLNGTRHKPNRLQQIPMSPFSLLTQPQKTSHCPHLSTQAPYLSNRSTL